MAYTRVGGYKTSFNIDRSPCSGGYITFKIISDKFEYDGIIYCYCVVYSESALNGSFTRKVMTGSQLELTMKLVSASDNILDNFSFKTITLANSDYDRSTYSELHNRITLYITYHKELKKCGILVPVCAVNGIINIIEMYNQEGGYCDKVPFFREETIKPLDETLFKL